MVVILSSVVVSIVRTLGVDGVQWPVPDGLDGPDLGGDDDHGR